MLTPLPCSSCGRPVPLGEGDVVQCPFCREDVAIPDEYARLRDAERLDDAARARAEAIAHELARPPSLFVIFWTGASGVAALLAVGLVVIWLLVSLVLCIAEFVDAGLFGAVMLLCLGLVLGLPLLYDEMLHALAEPLGTDFADVLGGGGAYGLLGLAILVVNVLPVVLGLYAASFESVRIALRKALAAVPSATEGGAMHCRGCGAPLAIDAKQVLAHCVYCRADNVVVLPDAARATYEDAMKATCSDLESALAEERATARRGKWTAARRLLRAAALVPGFILLGRCVASINENDATFWYRADRAAPMVPKTEDNPLIPREVPTLFAVHQTFDDCDDVDCRAYYFVPLQRGETVALSVEGGDLRLGAAAALNLGPWYNPTYDWRPIDLADGAPHTGWFRIELVTTKARGPEPTIRWTTTR